MSQPKFAPIPLEDEVRPGYRLGTPGPWAPHRPGDLHGRPTRGLRRGSPGPDQGYALRLARRLADRVQLAQGEHLEDALTGAVVVALCRASLLGRAPVLGDLELGLGLFGYLGGPGGTPAPEGLVAERKRLLAGAGHDYWDQRVVADRVPETALRCSPEQVRERIQAWQELLGS